MDIIQVDDHHLDEESDYTEEYSSYLSNFETSYDICISIDFITQRLNLAERSLAIHNDRSGGIEEEDIEAHFDTLDHDHCAYVLTMVLPKSIEYLCKTDVNNLYHQDILQYQKSNHLEISKTTTELREFLVTKTGAFFERVITLILRLKPSTYPEFYDVISLFLSLSLLFILHYFHSLSLSMC